MNRYFKPAVYQSLQRSFFFFLLAMFVSIILAIIVSYQSNKAFKDTSFWVRHTETVLNEAEEVASLSKDLQLESGGFYITGDSSFLRPYAIARNNVLAHFGTLKKLTTDNASQQQRISLLQEVLNNLIAFSDSSVQMRKMQTSNVSLTGNVLRRGQLRNKIDRMAIAIKGEEKRLLLYREAANNKSIEATTFLFYALIGFIFLLLTLAFFIIPYHFNKRKKAEEELRESDARFHLLINNIKDFAIIMMDRKGIITNWYSGAEFIKGYTDVEVIGKPVSIFYTKEDIENGVPELNLKTAAAEGSYETEGWRLRKDGSRFWANVVIRAIYDDEGQVEGFTKVSRDYTLHKKAEDNIKNALEQERELSEMKSNFVTMASHEFRTPLSAILSSTTLLEQYTLTEQQDKRARHIQRIQSSVADLTSLLEEFLSLEKIEQGKVAPHLEQFNIKEFITKFCNKIQNVTKPGQTISYIHTGAEQVAFDPSILRHILTNLTSNAIKYSPENKPILILTQVANDTITLSVKDDGMGITEEGKKHLFERFYRAANAGNIQGTGLGLHIVKRYVDMVQGTITVKSEEGKGTEFIIELENKKM